MKNQNNQGYFSSFPSEQHLPMSQQLLAAMRLNAMSRGVKWIDSYQTTSFPVNDQTGK